MRTEVLQQDLRESTIANPGLPAIAQHGVIVASESQERTRSDRIATILGERLAAPPPR